MEEWREKMFRECVALGFKITGLPSIILNNVNYSPGDVDKIPSEDLNRVEKYLWNLNLHQKFGRHY